MGRKSRVEAWDTTSFINYLFELAQNCGEEEYKVLQKQLMEFHMARRKYPQDGKILSCVAFAKLMLGKQDYTWTGSHRNWVWERNDWRLFVNNTQGFSFEVREGLSLEKAMTAWNDVRALLDPILSTR